MTLTESRARATVEDEPPVRIELTIRDLPPTRRLLQGLHFNECRARPHHRDGPAFLGPLSELNG